MIGQIIFPTAEFVIPKGVATNEANPDIEMQPVISEAKMKRCST